MHVSELGLQCWSSLLRQTDIWWIFIISDMFITLIILRLSYLFYLVKYAAFPADTQGILVSHLSKLPVISSCQNWRKRNRKEVNFLNSLIIDVPLSDVRKKKEIIYYYYDLIASQLHNHVLCTLWCPLFVNHLRGIH